MGARVTRCSGNATGAQRGAYSRVCGASTAFRPVAVGVGGAELGAPMSQSAYSRVCGASTAKGAAQRGCSATGPTPRATGSLAALGYAVAGPASRRRQDPLTTSPRGAGRVGRPRPDTAAGPPEASDTAGEA